MLKRTLNDFYEVGGNTLISNNYEAFNTDILEIRIQAIYGNRPLRPFTDSKIKIMAQNVVDMWSGYLPELFNFAKEYNILTPEMKQIIREMSYNKTNDDTRNIKRTDTDITHTGIGVDTTNNTTIGAVHKTSYGKDIDNSITRDNSDNGKDDYTDTATHTGTSETVGSGTTGDTSTKSVSAYNQTDPIYSPREQDVTNGTNSNSSTLTNNLEDKTVHSGTYQKNSGGTETAHESQSGQDVLEINSNQNDHGTQTTTSDSNTNGTSDTDDTFSGNETYNLNENITEKGRLSYEELLNTIENLFNPYDWLATKIVNTICEVFYYERIR